MRKPASHPVRRVLIYTPTGSDDYARALGHRSDIDIRAVGSPEAVLSARDWPDIFIGAGLGPNLLLDMPRLDWVQWVWAGVDSLMSDTDFSQAVADGRLRLTRAVGVFGRSIGEYVVTWCLSLAWQVPRILEAQNRHLWERFQPELLQGRRLGVAGLGDIGSGIALLAGRVGLSVSGLCRSGRSTAPVEGVYTPDRIVEFVKDLDYLVLALPLTPETRGLVSARVLASMKPTSVLVNVGRGALVDEEALVRALRSGRPGRAVLDVVSTEPLPPSHELWTLPNVVITPHIAAITRPADLVGLLEENLDRHREGRPLRGEVSGFLGY